MREIRKDQPLRVSVRLSDSGRNHFFLTLLGTRDSWNLHIIDKGTRQRVSALDCRPQSRHPRQLVIYTGCGSEIRLP